jgi:transcription elongation factor GreA
MPTTTGAPDLLRSVGLMADGPVVWGRQVPASGAGVFVIEFPAPLATAPIELTRVGKWIERVETLRLDGQRPSSRALVARLATFWLPSQTVVYIGSTEASISRRVAAIVATELGERKPNPGAHWLKTLRSLDGVRIWWTVTDAPVEYEDALLTAFAEAVPAGERAALPDTTVILPFANLRRPTGERKATGLTGSLIPEPTAAPSPPTRVVQLPDGDAEGARGEPPPPKRRASGATTPGASTPGSSTGATPPAASARPAPPPPPPSARRPAASRPSAPASSAPPPPPGATDGSLTVEGEARLRAELEELSTVKRPAVIARVRTAREHGDLKENSEYHAAREEQSFLEGRIQALEARLRTAVIVEAPSAGSRAGLGSVVTVEEDDGISATYTIVGAAESDPKSGRISSSSPVGRALVGREVGDDIEVVTPAGILRYRIVSIS